MWQAKSDKAKRSRRQEEPVYIFSGQVCSEKYASQLNGKRRFFFGEFFFWCFILWLWLILGQDQQGEKESSEAKSQSWSVIQQMKRIAGFKWKPIMNCPSSSKNDMYLIWGMLTTRAFSTKWLLLDNKIWYMFTCNLCGWTVMKQLFWSYTNKCITSLLCIMQTAAFKKQS